MERNHLIVNHKSQIHHFSPFNMKYLVFHGMLLQNFVYMFTIGIRNKNLTKVRT